MSKKQLYDVSEVVDSLVKTYKNINRKKKPVYGYEGPLLSLSKILACSPNINEQFTEEGIEYHNEQGRSLLHLVILSAFQLGIEQDINMCANDIWTLSSKDWDEEDFDHNLVWQTSAGRYGGEDCYYGYLLFPIGDNKYIHCSYSC